MCEELRISAAPSQDSRINLERRYRKRWERIGDGRKIERERKRDSGIYIYINMYTADACVLM